MRKKGVLERILILVLVFCVSLGSLPQAVAFTDYNNNQLTESENYDGDIVNPEDVYVPGIDNPDDTYAPGETYLPGETYSPGDIDIPSDITKPDEEYEKSAEDEKEQEFQPIVPFGPVTVTFVPNGVGAWIDSAAVNRTVNAGEPLTASHLPAPELFGRPGFALHHWNSEQDGTGFRITGDTIINQNMNAYAIWGFRVVFFGGPGVTLTELIPPNPNNPNCYSDRIVIVGESVATTDGMTWPNPPQRPGFTFNGWWDEVTNTEIFETTIPTSAMSVHGRWTMNPIYRLTFDPMGGSFATGQIDTRYAVGPNPATNSPGVNIAGSHAEPFWLNRNAPNHGVINPGGVAIPRHNTAPLAVTWPTTSNEARTLHSWRWQPYGGGVQASTANAHTAAQYTGGINNIILLQDTTVYANWVYRVVFNLQSGTWPGTTEGPVTWGSIVRDIPVYNLDGTPTGGGTVADDARVWVGFPAPPNHIVRPDQRAPAAGGPFDMMPPDPTRVGYIFGGWLNENPDYVVNWGTGEVAWPHPRDPNNAPPNFTWFFEDCHVNYSRTVYALWIRLAGHTVTFNPFGGAWIGAMADLPVGMPSGYVGVQTREVPAGAWLTQTPAPGTSPRFNMPIFPTRNNFVFMGWYEDINDPNTRFNGNTPVTSDVTVYARWVEAVRIMLDFDGATTPALQPQFRDVPLGYSLEHVAQIWNDTRQHASALGAWGNHALPIFSRPGCTGLSEHQPVQRWAPQPVGVFSTELGGQGERFGMDTVVDSAWLLANGGGVSLPPGTAARVYAVWAPIITFNRNHSTFVSGTTDYTVQRQIICGSSFVTNTLSGLHRNPALQITIPANLGPPFVAAIPGDINVGQAPRLSSWVTLDNWRDTPLYPALGAPAAHAAPAAPGPLALGGRLFLGWFTTPGNVNNPLEGTQVFDFTEITHDTTLYARFGFGVEFRSGYSGGAAVPANVILPGNERRIVGFVTHPPLGNDWPPNPVWNNSGVIVPFQGWNTEPDATGYWHDHTSNIVNSKVLYAIWGGGVTFNAHGGEFPNGDQAFILTHLGGVLGPAFNTVPTPVEFVTTYGSLRFRHWNTRQHLADIIAEPGQIVTSAAPALVNGQHVWAQWDVPITFNPGLGTWIGNAANPGTLPGQAQGANVTRYAPMGGNFDTVFPAPLPAIVNGVWPLGNANTAPTLAHHTFMGWTVGDPPTPAHPYISSETIRTAERIGDLLRPRTYTAVWYPNVTFDLAGGNVAGNTNDIVRPTRRGMFVQPLAEIPVPARAGMVFVGWRYSENNTPETIQNQSAGTPNQTQQQVSERQVNLPITWTAQWELEVSFDLNGGIYAPGTNNIVGTPLLRPNGTENINRPVEDGQSLTGMDRMPGVPTRENYVFGGWQRVMTGQTPVVGGATLSPVTVGNTLRVTSYGYEYRAVWYPIITFNLAGGNVAGDATTPIFRTVRFNGILNNGTVTAATLHADNRPATIIWPAPVGLGMPADPVRTGFAFQGWRYTEVDGTSQVLGTPHLTRDQVMSSTRTVPRTYTAIWYPIITFDPNGGTIPSHGLDENVTRVVAMDGNINNNTIVPLDAGMPANPVRSGYEFGGWRRITDQAATTIIVQPDVVGTEIRTAPQLYEAVWAPVVTFNLNGGVYVVDTANRPLGTENIVRVVDRHGTLASDIVSPVNATMPGNPTREGFVFAGWRNIAVNSVVEYPVQIADRIRTASTTYTAVWYPLVRFDPNGGTIPGYLIDESVDRIARHGQNLTVVTPQMLTFLGHELLGMIAPPTRDGYVFAGWGRHSSTFPNVMGYISQTPETHAVVTNRVRTGNAGTIFDVSYLYVAIWSPVITFNPGQGTTPIGNPNSGIMPGMQSGEEVTRTVVRGTALGATIPGTPTLLNHTFMGWRYTAPTIQDPLLEHRSHEPNVRDTIRMATRTYTAVWYPNITFNLAGGTFDDGTTISTANIIRQVPVGGTLYDNPDANYPMLDNPVSVELCGIPYHGYITRDGYVFGGWRRVMANVNHPDAVIILPLDIETGVEQRVRLVPYVYMAVWNPVITFDLNGGTFTCTFTNVCPEAILLGWYREENTYNVLRAVERHGTLTDDVLIPNGAGMIANPTRAGHTFAGWQNADGEIIGPLAADILAYIANIPRNATATYIAVWTPTPPTGGRPGGTTIIEDEERPLDFVSDHIWYVRGFPDGSFRPGNSITRAEMSMILFRLLDSANKYTPMSNNFSDVTTGWYAQAVSYLASHNIVRGYPDGTFRPNSSITRAELTAVMSRFFEINGDGAHNFPDVNDNHWAIRYIINAVNRGWVIGFEDDTFRPENSTTRAEAVTMLNRVLVRRPNPETIRLKLYPHLEYYFDMHDGLFTDITSSHWAYYDIMEAAVEHFYTLDENGLEIWSEIFIPWLEGGVRFNH